MKSVLIKEEITMKKKSIILCSAAFLSAMISCQKENISSPQQDNQIHKTVTIADESWSDGTVSKSLYEEGIGVHLTKLENMSVYYWKYTEGVTAPASNCPLNTLMTTDEKNKNITGAEAETSGNWKFSHAEIDNATKYNYFFIIPHASTNALNSTKTGHSFRLSSVQFPENLHKFNGNGASSLSFDPTMDCHIGEAQYGVDKADKMSDIHFKRVFTPLKLTITDSGNILGEEAIYSVTLRSDAEAKQKQTLTGVAYFNHSNNYEEAKVSSIGSSTVGNGVTTLYTEPLKKTDECYTTWYIVNPTTIPASNLTVSVTTATKTITRTVATTAELQIIADKINTLSFDISGEGYSTETTDFYNFTTLTNLNKQDINTVAGSNTKEKPWSKNACNLLKDVGNSYFTNAFRIPSNGSLKYTAIEGKKLKKVRFYGHPRAQTISNTRTVSVIVKSGDTEIGRMLMSFDNLSKNGGYDEFEVPETYASSDLTFGYFDAEIAISAAQLFFTEAQESTTAAIAD